MWVEVSLRDVCGMFGDKSLGGSYSCGMLFVGEMRVLAEGVYTGFEVYVMVLFICVTGGWLGRCGDDIGVLFFDVQVD